MSHARTFLDETARIAAALDADKVEEMARCLHVSRRLFVIGLGGSAANASHAVNDFRKLCGIDAHCPTDNVAELTAWANDASWESMFTRWFEGRNIQQTDAVLVLSVGGGTDEVSTPITAAVKAACRLGACVLGIVGRDGGATKAHGHCVIVIPTVEPSRVTPHAEAFQSVILHALVSHPLLQRNATKW